MLKPEWCQTDEKRIAMQGRLLRIRERVAEAAIKSGRHERDVSLMAVTKTMPVEAVNAAIDEGITLLGENRAQELENRADGYKPAEVQFIGHLQTNKVKKVVPLVTMIQSVDSLRLGQEISRQAERFGKHMDILLEINSGGEESKSGVPFEAAHALAEELAGLPHLSIRGLMTIPPPSDDAAKMTGYFRRMYKLFVDMKDKKMDNVCMDILSMGMSDDYEWAIMEGATLIRIGSALFGPRNRL